MKSKSIFYALLLVTLIQTSCKSTKDFTMFQDMKNKSTLHSLAKEPPRHVIKAYDNLYVNILTLDQDVNLLFNPNLGGNSATTNTQHMYGTPSGQYINGYQVRQDGTITIPILGEVKVDGLTLDEAEEKIKKQSEEYLKEPTVKVKLLNYRVDVLGEVNSPDIYYNYEGTLNIFEALAYANGITLYADLKNVVVNRKTGSTTKTYKVDLTDSDIYESEVFYLQPNDLIYIPPTKLKRRNENNSTISIVLSAITTIVAGVAIFK